MLSDDETDSNQCYLTRQRSNDGAFDIGRYLLKDKHGLTRYIYNAKVNIYNAKVNIYRRQAAPIYLGVQDNDLAKFQASDPKNANSSAAEWQLPRPNTSM